jgi:putative endonuclease
MAKIDSTVDGWFVYIIKTADGKFYTGITTDVDRRFREHAEGKKGARFFRTTQPVHIAWKEPHPDRSSASKREREIKKMTRQQKLSLLADQLKT